MNTLLGFWYQLLFIFRFVASLALMLSCACIMLLCSMLTLFKARRYITNYILPPFADLLLKIWGIRYVVHGENYPQAQQVVYVFNHTSTIDLFLLLALRLPNTRYFLWGGLRRNPLIALIGYLIGVFWTVSQQHPLRRAHIFQEAEAALKQSRESVFLSPEGVRVTSGEIGHFNKGAFHLATNLGVPMQPIFIAIPQEMNPGSGWHAKPGVIHVHFKPVVASNTWQIAELLANKERVREQFIQWNIEHRIPHEAA